MHCYVIMQRNQYIVIMQKLELRIKVMHCYYAKTQCIVIMQKHKKAIYFRVTKINAKTSIYYDMTAIAQLMSHVLILFYTSLLDNLFCMSLLDNLLFWPLLFLLFPRFRPFCACISSRE